MDKQHTILGKLENKVRQQIFGGVSVALITLMFVLTFGFTTFADDTTNLSFNITAGSFTIENAPESMAFATHAYGVSNDVLANEELDDIAITDYRGNAQAWSVAMNANNLQSGSDHIDTASALNGYVSNGDMTNVENADTNRTAVGSDGFLDGAGVTLINGSTQASGIFRYDNGVIRLTVDGSEAAGEYGAVVTYTLS
ncbi:MAG: hypothetical protein U9M89_01690 [Patescibacteria group bacterium]|nr:hypothetical protein [Patescibacteria group bacterium]